MKPPFPVSPKEEGRSFRRYTAEIATGIFPVRMSPHVGPINGPGLAGQGRLLPRWEVALQTSLLGR